MIPATYSARLSAINTMIATDFGRSFQSTDTVETWLSYLAATRPELGLSDSYSAAGWVLEAPEDRIGRLLGQTGGFTSFFRTPALFHALETDILPELIASRAGTDRSLRIWSAGCSKGAEPYSVAITLYKLLPDLSSWDVTITATDINRTALEKAGTGRYTQFEIASCSQGVVEHCFTQSAGGFTLLREIRDMVRFGYLNLAEDRFPRDLDVIVCCNVLMYLTGSCQQRVIRKFGDSLVEGGFLFMGLPLIYGGIGDPRLVQEERGGVAVFRKRGLQ